MFNEKTKEELGNLFMNMALASFVFAILQPVLNSDDSSLQNIFIGFILWVSFLGIGVFFLNKVKGAEDGK